MVILLGLGLLLVIPVAHAFGTPVGAQLIVTTTADVLADDGLCSLREAIQAANLDVPSGTLAGECVAGTGDDTILLGVGTYEIEIEGTNEDQNLTGDFDVKSSLTIAGHNPDATFMSGNHLDRVLQIHTGIVSILDIAIVYGKLPLAFEDENAEDGGGIYNAGTLFIERVNVLDNAAGNGLYDIGSSGLALKGGPGGKGGGIYTSGHLTIRSSVISRNIAGHGGRGQNGSYNAASGGIGGLGGGLFIDYGATANLSHTYFIENRSGHGGDAGDCDNPRGCFEHPPIGGHGGNGGGIYISGTLTITNSVLLYNMAGNGGGSGNQGGSQFGAGGDGGGFSIDSVDVAIIKNSSIAGNRTGLGGNFAFAYGIGGGIMGSASIQNTIISNNLRAQPDDRYGSDCLGVLQTIESVLVTETQGCTVNGIEANDNFIKNYNPQLGALGELLLGSIAIDAGNCPDTDIDYLGDPRHIDDLFMPNFGDACDIGADELASPLLQVGPIPIQVTEGGTADLFALVLTQQPSADVTISFTNSQVFVGPQTLLFTPENWNVQQAVGVLAIDNQEIDFTRIDYIDMSVESADPRYNNLAVGDLAVQIRDNDAPMIYLPTVTGRD